MAEQFYQGLFGRDENYEKNCLRLANDGGHKAVVVTLGSGDVSAPMAKRPSP